MTQGHSCFSSIIEVYMSIVWIDFEYINRSSYLLPRKWHLRRADLDFVNHVGMESLVADFLWSIVSGSGK